MGRTSGLVRALRVGIAAVARRAIRRRWFALATLLAPACAVDTQTQALITVEVDAALLEHVAWVDVQYADASGQPVGRAWTFPLIGEGRVASPFSFGALGDENDLVRMHVRAFAAATDHPLLDQPVELVLSRERVTSLRVPLRCDESTGCHLPCSYPEDPSCPRPNGTICAADRECSSTHCSDGVCCASVCATSAAGCFSCNQPEALGQCVPYVPKADPRHCLGCNVACATTHVDEAICSEGACLPICERGFGDCDRLRNVNNGCETDLAVAPEHCGACGNSCPFHECQGGSCLSSPMGFVAGEAVASRPMNALFGVRFPFPEGTHVVGLGIKLHLDRYLPNARTNLRLALYSEDAEQRPLERRTQCVLTSDETLWKERGIVSVHGGVECPVSGLDLHGQGHWLFVIADQDVWTRSPESFTQSVLKSRSIVSYSALDSLPDNLVSHDFEILPGQAVPALYAVTTRAN